MTESTVRIPWIAPPSAKTKNAVQRSVTALLNQLAPEREVKRASPTASRIETHRMPSGCVLQAASAAVSVSWFVTRDGHAALGELQIIVWRGIVSQRGANQKGATIVSELIFIPVTPSEGACVWKSADGSQCDSSSVAATCMALLEAEIERSFDYSPPVVTSS